MAAKTERLDSTAQTRRHRMPAEGSNSGMRIAMLLLILTLVSGGLIQGRTQALLTDNQSIPNNQFTTGTIVLKLSDDNETDQDNVTATWTGTSLHPGDSVNATLTVKNVGSAAGSQVQITTSNGVTEAASPPGSTGTVPMDRVLEVIVFNYDGVDKKSLITDVNGNGIKDLDDMEGLTITGLTLTDLNVAHTIEVTVLFNFDISANEHHGDSVTTTFTIILTQ